MKTSKRSTKVQKQMKTTRSTKMFTLILGASVITGMLLTGCGEKETAEAPVASIEIPKVDESVYAEPMIIEAPAEVVTVVQPTALEVEPPRIVTYASAEKAYFDGDFKDAALQFSEYSKEHSSNAWGFYMLGLAEMKAGDENGAEIAFQTALSIKPDHVKSLVNYGRLLLAMDRTEDARTQVELALVVDPANTSANRVLGRIYHNLQELESAKTAYKTVLMSKPNDAWSLNNLGLICIEQGHYADAIAPLAKATGLKTNVACFHNNLGVALERIGQYEAATEAFASALDADGNYAKAEISLARVENMDEAYDTVSIDLIALAANFTVAETIVVEIQEEESTDMEVATAMVVAELVEIETISELEDADQ